MAHKVVICGAGFLGKNIARAIAQGSRDAIPRTIQISSRRPEKTHSLLAKSIESSTLLPPVPLDVTNLESLRPAFQDSQFVVSLVGLLTGTPKQFDDIQWKGAENVARAAKDAGAMLIHISAIGADADSEIPYMRTKGLAEQAVHDLCSDATVIRPSLVFGPEDDFFNKFSRLSRFLPCLPVFDGGKSRFQPVFVGDLARTVEIITRHDRKSQDPYAGKIIEAGGPEVFTFKEIMELVLKYNGRMRPIVSLPLSVGNLQAMIMEMLPPNIFTLTRDQLKQLSMDNVVQETTSSGRITLQQLFEEASLGPLTSVHEVLPTYL
ncbi:hypothetical protein M378DRAFT_183061 [Amanita muscaria Koide BX008]|uniref:NAD-dependent epimerase/dehydratase domain-containing protein n=1 Tax=Amanita muscaria (strain Koide BX008) TaxID=946122 RepID=A0A0C2XBA8_AMAMK|nr:hypothetical protein M378DRAFT_183061 [Amanita muscaria Koide BX008]